MNLNLFARVLLSSRSLVSLNLNLETAILLVGERLSVGAFPNICNRSVTFKSHSYQTKSLGTIAP